MDGGSWHCTGDRDQDHPQGKEMQKSKMAIWGGLTNSCVKKRSEKHESWTIKKMSTKDWYFWTVVLEKTLESPLYKKKIQPVHPRNDPWILIGRTDAETETPVPWPPDAKNRFIGKDPDAGKDWRQEEKGMTEDEMVGWHHWLDGHEFEQAGSWWWTGRPDLHQSMGLQRVRQELRNWTE